MNEVWVTAQEAIARACAANFWEWGLGSRPFFWLWTEPFEKDICHGVESFVEGVLPSYTLQMSERKKIKRDEKWELVTEKIGKIRAHQYVW